MPNITKRGFKKPLPTEAYDLDVVNFNTDKSNELFEAQDIINQNVNQQMEQKADKVYKPNGWKTEADLPSSYPNKILTVFEATTTFEKLTSGAQVFTLVNNLLGIQIIFRAHTQPLSYRLKPGALDTWGAWQTIATSEDLEQKADLVDGKVSSDQLPDMDYAPTGHEHTKADIKDFPTSLPANGGNADTLGGKDKNFFLNATREVDQSAQSTIRTHENIIATDDTFGHVKIVSHLNNAPPDTALAAEQGYILRMTKAEKTHTHSYAPAIMSAGATPSSFVGEGVLFGVYS